MTDKLISDLDVGVPVGTTEIEILLNAATTSTRTDISVLPLGFKTAWKSADETIQSDATLTDDADLQFEAEASSDYAIFWTVLIVADLNADWKQAFSVPCGGTMVSQLIPRFDSWQTQTDMTASFTDNTSGSAQMMQGIGVIKIGVTAGTVAYQWSQQTSLALDTTLQKGSWISFKKLTV